MNPRRTCLVAFALLLALALSAAAGCGKPRSRESNTSYPVVAVVAQAQMGVEIRLSGYDCWMPGESSMPLMDGDSVWVPPGPGAFLLFGSGARMSLAGGTYISFLSQGGKRWLSLHVGEAVLDGIGQGGPGLRTPAAAVEVSPGKTIGGSLSVRVAPGGATTVTVASGSARVQNDAGGVTVPAGSTASCEAGGAPAAPQPAASMMTSLSSAGFPYFVYLQVEKYFSNEATRDRAEDDARSKLEATEEDAWSHVNLGRALLDAGDLSGARAQFERALSLDTQFSQAFAGLGKVAVMEGRWAEAQGAYASARRADPMSLEAVFGLGQAALGAGDLREAEKWFKETLDLDPEGTNPLTGLAIIDLIRQEPNKAISGLKQAASSDPTRTKAYPVLAIAYSMRGDLYSARESLVNAVEIDPDDYRARAGLAAMRARLGDMVAAGAAFKDLTGSDESGWKAAGYQGMGVLEQLEGSPGAALDDWNKSRELVPGLAPVDIDAGQARLLLEDYDAAIDDFEKAVAADPAFWLAHEWLARAYLARKTYPQATTEAQAAVTLNPAAWVSRMVLARSLESSAPEESRRELAEARRLMPTGKLSATERVLLKGSGGEL